MTRGSPTITIRLRGDLKRRLTEAARSQGRTVTDVAEPLLLEWTNANYLAARLEGKDR